MKYFMLTVIAAYLTVIAAQFDIIEHPHNSGNYYLTSEGYKDDPKARIHLNKGDILLRKVVSPDGTRDLYVGQVQFLGRKAIEKMGGLIKSHTTEWIITHTDSERRTATSIMGTKIPPLAKAEGRKAVQRWLNEDPYWDFGYAADANTVGYEYINTGTDASKNYKVEFIEKEGGTTRIWKTKSGHPKEPWNEKDIGKDPRKGLVSEVAEGIGGLFHFGRKKKKNANVMGYDELLQDNFDYYYDHEDHALALLRRIDRNREMLRRLERDREE
eukprot:458694_1